MVSGMKKAIMALVIVMLALPALAQAQAVHFFKCADCHRSGQGLTDLNNNICMICHKDTSAEVTDNNSQSVSAQGRFNIDDASNAMSSHPGAPSQQTSHYWASMTETVPAAGAVTPTTYATKLNGKYGLSRGKVICSRCHDPHLDNDVSPHLLKVANDADQLCKDCHKPWNVANADASLTHPVGPTTLYSNFAADARFKPVVDNTQTTYGDIRLVAGEVSCTSCHITHFADSDSTTQDGKAQSRIGNPGYTTGLNAGDGKLLRSDGALKTVTPYNNANSILQAQIRSNLCQACHTYQTHGKVGYEPSNDLDLVDEQVGCLDCHSGHSYNGGTPNFFVLRNTVSTASYGAGKTTLYTTNPTNWETYCTSCHGPVSGFPTTLRAHTPGESCKGCHAHDAVYSFAMGENATVCGDCHGSPPRTNTPAVPGDMEVDTGYAVGPDVNYLSSGQNGKDESRTPHKIHAGALNADKAVVDYAFGSTASGLVSACLPCHNDQPDTVTPTHNTGVSAGSFQSIYFSSFATISGLSPTYKTTTPNQWTCSNVYCHSNGGKRNASGTKVTGDFKTTQTPAWALGSNPGTIVGTGTECQWCHGENIATMAIGAAATQKGNSQTHNRHLTKLNNGLNNKTTCYICHSDTADDTGAVPAAARDIRSGGKHVNGAADVVFNSAALGGALSAGSYTGGASGTCSVYCHNPSTLDTAGGTFDWDNFTGAALACDACHEGLATDAKPISTGSHTRHIAAAGANVKCDSCHGTGAALGTHSGHVDGQVTKLTTAASCDICHGVENTAAWDVTPTWGLPTSVDCRTCHVDSVVGGNSVTSYVDNSSVTRQVTAANSLDKSNFSAKGHGKTGVAKVCTECHDSAYSVTHMNATTGDNRLQVLSGQNYGVSVNGFCAVCHVATTNPHFDNSQTSGGASVSGTTCNICHNPHGQVGNTMDAMIVNSIGGRTVSGFADRNVRGSYFINPPSAAGYGICQVCHDPNAPDALQHFNWNIAEPLHQDATNTVKCIQCHSHSNTPGFQKSGDSCESCHAAKVAEPRHARHTSVTPSIDADKSDCAKCHPNAASYTISGGHADHMTGSTNLVAAIVVNDGGTGKTTCASVACHGSGTTDGFWQDTDGLNCNACHGGVNADGHPAGARHDKHLTAGMSCSGCHTGIDAQGPGPLTHNDSESTATDVLKLETRGSGYVNTSGLDAEVDDSTWNVGGGSTWVNGAGTTNNTCSNTLCHDPSNTGTVADFDTSVASCSLCHGYGTTMASGSHSLHVNNAAVIGDNFACTVCHPDNSVPGTAHTLTGGNVQGVVTVAGSKANTYGGEVALPNTAYGTCTASQCHNDGKGANVASPVWGRAPQSGDNCTICHGAPPTTGDHGDGASGHWQSARTTLGLGCVSCHNGTAASNTAIKAGSLHLNGDSYNVAQGGTYNAVAVTINPYTPGSPSTCTASCHAANPKNWAAANSCEDCHAAKIAEPRHVRHVNVSPTIDADKTDCAQCHPNAGSYTIGGGHADHQTGGATTLNAGIVNLGGGNYSCNTLCHLSSAGDGSWTDANGLNCDACHYYSATPSGAGNQAHAKVISATHNEHFNKNKGCTECHGTLENSGNPMVGPLTHITASGANQGAILAGKALASADEANVTRTSMVYNGTNNTCSGGIGLGCHATGTPDWDLAINDCVSCHTNETDATVNPTSGLHNFATATRHDDTLQTGACVNCHDATSPSSLHMNGTLNNSTAATYTFNATKGIVYSAASGCQANGTCHSDGGDWNRKWTGAVDARPLATDNPAASAVCGNCHGTFNTGWRDVNTNHVNPYAGNDPTDGMSNHSVCETCHGWGNANYDANWGAPSANNGHGDGSITMNGPSGTGAGYNDASGGCTAACHAESFALNTNSGWTANFGNFGAGSACDTCHGGGGESAPSSTAYPNRGGKHSEHVQAIAIKLGGNTAANRNASCDYCHLNPGEPGHNTNNAPLNAADVTNIRRIIGGALDSNPVVNGAGTSYVTCSNIDCHFDMPRTPHWYTDNIAPAAVTLTAVAGPKPRSVKVTWNAPGDDNNVADTTPYVYDLRMGTTAGEATNFGLTTNYAGNLPPAYKQGYVSEAIIQNLNPGTTYYFSLKTRDTDGNWSTASAVVSAQPTVDTVAPAFGGADKASKADSSGTVYLTWTPAEDHTMPITYKVWQKTEAAGALNMNVDAPLLTSVKGHKIVLGGLTNDTIYNFGVRACDANNNCDTNTQIVSATPTAEPLVTKTNHTYRTNNTALLLTKDGAFGATGNTGLALTAARIFSPTANVAHSVTYYADTFAIYLDAPNSGGPHTVQAEFGSYNGTTFTSLVTKSVTFGNRQDRIYQFKFSDAAGKTFAANLRPAVRLSQTAGTGVLVNYGTATYRGDLTMAERIVNAVPTNPSVNATVSGANVNVTWTASTDNVDGLSDTVHYDLFGSDDNGANYRYLIAEGLTGVTNYSWNTQEDGISGSATVAVKLLPGDGYGHYTGATTTKTNLAVNNSADNVAPSAITDLVAKPRPKSGSVQLIWTAPGDDGHNNGRAKYYDIRYSTAAITEGNFASATQCVNEPSPDFGGEIQNFEVTGLTPGQNYYFAIKTYDDGNNASPISTAKSAGSDQAVGGPRCGMCHSTAPSIVESVGNHKLHGFTLNDCTKCHGAVVATYGLDHQDGLLKMGYGPAGPQQAIISGNRIYYTNDGTPGGTIMYDDVDGFGGFGNGSYASVGDGTDDGTCMNFGAMGVGGCHSAAGTDPDGAGPLPTYPTPTWTDAATLNCAACHGNPSRTTDSFYGRAFDATTANGGIVPDQIKGAPVIDNHGNYNLADPDEKDRKFIGQHEKHLNYSFRFSKGDNCNLCHQGNYQDVNDLDGRHANGDVDVKLDLTAAGPNATWTPGTATTAGTCSNMSPDSCHPSASAPKWDSAQNFDCVGCHNMGGTTPSHVTDPAGGVSAADNGWATDPMAGNCTYCHIGGHPRDDVGGTSLILANSSQVGINYKSGGIHLKKSIGGRAAQATEAQLCWQCHDANNISEWGTDTGGNNVSTRPANASDYNYGTVTSSNWTTATWSSAIANFGYKTGAIQSTHSTNELGTSAVTGGLKARVETKDTVGNIRCSNCHDVHNLNKAPGDTMTGQPYLRGTWIRNPYPEDGAPWNKTYTSVNLYGPVPRGGVGNNQQGGFQIDQNNNYPTAGLSLATSAGLCTLCHGTDVDNMDKTTGENFWMTSGRNGHSNATLGGTADPTKTTNIFGKGVGGRPNGTNVLTTGTTRTQSDVFDMGLQYTMLNGTPGSTRGLGYRSARYAYLNPKITNDYAYQVFDWGVTVDATTIDVGYHAFTCSKCHNPHASRLPKLMITNCLDTGHNTWDDAQGSVQNWWTSPDDNGETTATHNTAQNCHRFDAADNVGGWNTVTPW